MDIELDTVNDLLAWAVGDGGAPHELRANTIAGLGDCGPHNPRRVAYLVVERVRDRVLAEVPEAKSDEIRNARRCLPSPRGGPEWAGALAPLRGLAARIADSAARALPDVLAEKTSILAAYAQREADRAQRLAEINAADAVRRRIEHAARVIGDSRDDVAGHERGIRMAVGELAIAAEAAVFDGRPIVDRSSIAYLTEHSRPSVYKYAAAAAEPEGRDLTRVTNAALAEMHLGYGFSGHEGVAREFWLRFPHLAGWFNAARWLQAEYDEVWWAARGGEDPMSKEQPPNAPGYQELMRGYRERVEAIAAGPLASDND